MKVSRISLAVKSAFVLSLPLLLLGCQGGSNSSAAPAPPAGNVSASVSQVTPAVQAVTISNSTAKAASVTITPPTQATYFDFYALNQGNAPAWCTGNTCSIPCPSTTFSLGSGQSCKVYLHATNAVAVGNTQAHDQIQVSINGNTSTYSLTNTAVLYAGGYFKNVDGKPAIYAASWNGSSWSSMGSLPTPIYSLGIAPNGTVYSGTDYSGIFSWTNNQWNLIGNTNHIVGALAFDPEGNLYVGGEFTEINNETFNHIAEFDGTNWLPVSNPLAQSHGVTGFSVNALLYESGKLYMGGFFNQVDGQMLNNIAVYDPTAKQWSPMTQTNQVGYPFDGGINALAMDNNGRLIAGGDFLTADGHYVGHIAQLTPNGNWTGITNSITNPGLNVQSYALAIDNQNNIYTGGDFTTADNQPANSMAMWNQTDWSAVTSSSASSHGMSGTGQAAYPVVSLAYDKNSHILFAGGFFSTVDGLPMNNLAAWNGVNWSSITNNTASAHGFDAYVEALAIGNQLTVSASNS